MKLTFTYVEQNIIDATDPQLVNHVNDKVNLDVTVHVVGDMIDLRELGDVGWLQLKYEQPV